MVVTTRAPSYKINQETSFSFKDRSPSINYALSARCKDFAPHPQHDENPQVNCLKLDQKLEKFKNQIT